MKIKFSSFILVLLAVGIFSCNKYDFDYPKDQVGTSSIVYYPSIVLRGDPYVSIVVGDTYVDSGADAMVNGAPTEVTTTGTVDGSTVGIYTINYSAKNEQGYAATASRTVAVIPSAPTADISGTYYYIAAPGTTATITELAPGFYQSSNCWSSATTIACQLICVDGQNIVMPNQSTPYGELFGTATLTSGGALTYIVSIPSQGLNDVARKWHAQ